MSIDGKRLLGKVVTEEDKNRLYPFRKIQRPKPLPAQYYEYLTDISIFKEERMF